MVTSIGSAITETALPFWKSPQQGAALCAWIVDAINDCNAADFQRIQLVKFDRGTLELVQVIVQCWTSLAEHNLVESKSEMC